MMKLNIIMIIVVTVLLAACNMEKVEPEQEKMSTIPDCIPEEKRNLDYMVQIGIPDREELARLLDLPIEKVKQLKVVKRFDTDDYDGDPEEFSPDFLQRIGEEYWVGQGSNGRILVFNNQLELVKERVLSEHQGGGSITGMRSFDDRVYCTWTNGIYGSSELDLMLSVFSQNGEEKIKNNYNVRSFIISEGVIFDPEHYNNDEYLFKTYNLELKEIGVAGENVFKDITIPGSEKQAGPYTIKKELKLTKYGDYIFAHSINLPWAAKYNRKTGETSLIKYKGEIFRKIENLYFERFNKNELNHHIFFSNVKELDGEIYLRLGLPYRKVIVRFNNEWKPNAAWCCEVKCKPMGMMMDFDIIELGNEIGFMTVSYGYDVNSSYIEVLSSIK